MIIDHLVTKIYLFFLDFLFGFSNSDIIDTVNSLFSLCNDKIVNAISFCLLSSLVGMPFNRVLDA